LFLVAVIVVQLIFGVVQQIFFDKSKKVRKKTQECKNRRFLNFLKKIPPDPLKTFHCVQRAKKCSCLFVWLFLDIQIFEKSYQPNM
jgi:hypothetical protein